MTIWGHPAIFAGMVSISTVEGYAAVPPGTYTPTFSMGVTFCPSTIPGLSAITKLFRTCREWNARILAAASRRISKNSGSTRVSASSISSLDTSKEVSSALSNLAQ